MRAVHRISLITSPEERQAFERIGIDLQGKGYFEIDESDPRWPHAHRMAVEFQMLDLSYAEFTEAERRGATYLMAYGAWEHGYPESFQDGGYERTTYDSTKVCVSCGVGRIQVSPFRISGAPKWGSRSVRMLCCIQDEFFVTPESWENVFKPFGIECREVVFHKTGQAVDNMVQLNITSVARLDVKGLRFNDCPICGHRKYPYDLTGRYYHPMPENTSAPIFKSDIYWGTDAAAWKTIIVSQELYGAAKKAGLKGIGFLPCRAQGINPEDSGKLDRCSVFAPIPLRVLPPRVGEDSLGLNS